MRGENVTPHDNDFVSQLVTWFWVLFLSALGGLVSYYQKISQHKMAHSMFRLCGEMLTSALVGIITFMLCDYANFAWQLTASMVAISGHMGTRALFKLHRFYDLIKKGM